jgi:hypothetical protein
MLPALERHEVLDQVAWAGSGRRVRRRAGVHSTTNTQYLSRQDFEHGLTATKGREFCVEELRNSYLVF